MAFNLSNMFQRPSLTKQVTAGAGGARDAYLQHIQESAMTGQATLSWEEWLKQQQAQQQQSIMR